MIKLFNVEDGKQVGTLSEEQLQLMKEVLEMESEDDTDFYISADTIDLLEDNGADEKLLGILRAALGQREDMDIRWER